MSRIFHLIAFFCALLFSLCFIITHLVKIDLDSISSSLSMYALGQYGFIITIGFYSIGLTQVLLSIPLLVDDRYLLQKGAMSLFCAGFAVFLVAYFPTKLPPANFLSQLPHVLGAGIQFLMFPLAAMMLSSNMVEGKLKLYSLITGCVTFVFFLIILVLFMSRYHMSPPAELPFFGLLEKINIIVINLWLIVFSYYGYRHTRDIMFKRAQVS